MKISDWHPGTPTTFIIGDRDFYKLPTVDAISVLLYCLEGCVFTFVIILCDDFNLI